METQGGALAEGGCCHRGQVTLQPGAFHIQAAQAGHWSCPGKSPDRSQGSEQHQWEPSGAWSERAEATFRGPCLWSEDRWPRQNQAEQGSTRARQTRPSSDPRPPVGTSQGHCEVRSPSNSLPCHPQCFKAAVANLSDYTDL